MFNGLLNNLVRSVCFESFLNNLGFEETQLGWTDVNFEGAQHKKRRISNSVVDGHLDYSHPPTPQPSFDLNRAPIPSPIPHLDSDVDSSSASFEFKNTIESW